MCIRDRDNGIHIRFGDPAADKPGVNLILPDNPGLIRHREADIDHFRQSYIKKALKKAGLLPDALTEDDLLFLAEETNTDISFVKTVLGI